MELGTSGMMSSGTEPSQMKARRGERGLTADVEADGGDGDDCREGGDAAEHGQAQDEGQGDHEHDGVHGRLRPGVDGGPELVAGQRAVTAEGPQHARVGGDGGPPAEEHGDHGDPHRHDPPGARPETRLQVVMTDKQAPPVPPSWQPALGTVNAQKIQVATLCVMQLPDWPVHTPLTCCTCLLSMAQFCLLQQGTAPLAVIDHRPKTKRSARICPT